MSYHRDFEGVRIEDDGTTLRADATSIDDETGKPGTEDPASAFYVALVKAPAGGASHVSDRVAPGVDGSWSAVFPNAAADFADNPQVYVIGVAQFDEGPPAVWQELHEITSRTGAHGDGP